MKHAILLLIALAFFAGCNSSVKDRESGEGLVKINTPSNVVLLSSEIVWEKLNPARGDQSPQAGTIWGDRKGEVSTGFLAKFVDGFSSPPHIHNVTYRAVVIKGLIHNDDPEAANMWMKAGSFWTQPAGEAHITSAKGEECIALVEINKGPYLVKPTEEAHDNGQKPINIDATNLIWLDKTETTWIDSKSKAELSFLLEEEGLRSLFVKLPTGYKGAINSEGKIFHSVVIQGDLNYQLPVDDKVKLLDVGSYFGASSRAIHSVSNPTQEASVVYIRTNGPVFVN